MACWGNNDGAELRRRLPERADATLDGLRFTVVHETGASSGREARMANEYPDTDVLVFGHSHIPWDTTAKTGLRLLNPGSPTDRRRQPFCTYMTATVEMPRCRTSCCTTWTDMVTGRPGWRTCTARRVDAARNTDRRSQGELHLPGGRQVVRVLPHATARRARSRDGRALRRVIMIWVESEATSCR